ncbi:MAG: flagellar motor protein MotB [Planctomycetales bacterium]
MSFAVRFILAGALGSLALGSAGCNMVPRSSLYQAQNRTRQVYEQNMQTAQGLMAQNQQLQQQLADMQARGDTLQQRLDNLMSERNRLISTRNTNPLSDSATRQFEDLARRYPGFEFDSNTGVSKFQNDILFESGSDQLRPEAEPLLTEFARILNNGAASELNVLVVGHTDDRPVVKASTKARHPDNWYLSTHRAISVVHTLKKNGIQESRMGATGYGPHQPRVATKGEDARRQNRRVEIFVLAPNASQAGWDPNNSLR